MRMKAGAAEILRVGVDLAPPEPLQIGDPGSSDFRGFEVDLMNAVASLLGVRLHFQRAPWSQILGKLRSGSLDLVCSAATITENLKLYLDFGLPYCAVSLSIVSPKEHVWNSRKALTGKRVAVRAGTTAELFVRKYCASKRIATFETNTKVYEALLSHRADVSVDDQPIALALVRKYPGLRVSRAIPGTKSHYAMVFRKGDPLRGKVDNVLRLLRRNGLIAKLGECWFARE